MYKKVTHDIVHKRICYVMLCYVMYYVLLQALGQCNYIITFKLLMHR